MFRNLAGNLVLHERVETTDEKAKELRRIMERMVTRALRLGEDLQADIGKISSDEERARVVSKRIHAQREVAKFLPKKMVKTNSPDDFEQVDLVHKLFHEIAPRYLARALDPEQSGGGYTRIVKLGKRRGDNASISMIEFIGSEEVTKAKVNKVKTKRSFAQAAQAASGEEE